MIPNLTTHNEQKFEPCFPSSLIQDEKIPMNIPVEYIFTVYWKDTDERDIGNDSYMNMVYTVTYIDQITPELEANKNPVDVETTLTLDASESKFSQSKKKEGIMFKWICPDIFASYCEEWDGQPFLSINKDIFNTYGGVEGDEYQFTIETFSLNIGDRPMFDSQIFTKTVRVVWANIQRPKFTLVTPENILVTQNNEIQIILENYRHSDPVLEYRYELSPVDRVDLDMLEWSADKSVLFINQGAIQFQTTYFLKVTILNTATEDQVGTESEYSFTTDAEPIAGQIQVTPNSGNMFDTQFEITLSGYSSSNTPLSYQLYGVT